MGWQNAIGIREEPMECEPVYSAMSAALSPVRVSPAEAETPNRQRECRGSGPGKRNSAGWQETKTLICGQWMKFTFSSLVRDAGCGFHRRRRIPCCCTILRERVLDISARYVCAMGSWSTGARPVAPNAETCFAFLRQLWAASLRSDRRVVVITDNVRYHHATLHKEWREAAEPWFMLEFLPPYSPDLNPIERVWKLTRRIATHNRYFPSIEDVVTAVENTFNRWRRGNDALRRLCAIS
jgi:transposase